MTNECEWCGLTHDRVRCLKRPTWGRRGFLKLGVGAAVGVVTASLVPDVPTFQASMAMEEAIANRAVREKLRANFRPTEANHVSVSDLMSEANRRGAAVEEAWALPSEHSGLDPQRVLHDYPPGDHLHVELNESARSIEAEQAATGRPDYEILKERTQKALREDMRIRREGDLYVAETRNPRDIAILGGDPSE